MAKINPQDENGNTLLHKAIYIDYISHQLPCDIEDELYISQYQDTGPCYSAHCNQAQSDIARLIKEGSNPNIVNRYGYTPLHLAIIFNKTNAAALLIENGTDIHIEYSNNLERTAPLHLACAKGLFSIVKLLIEKGADINCRNHEGSGPLHIAVQCKQYEIVKLLIEKGADVNLRNCYGHTPLYFATYRPNPAIATLLTKNGADPSFLLEPKHLERLLYSLREKDFFYALVNSLHGPKALSFFMSLPEKSLKEIFKSQKISDETKAEILLCEGKILANKIAGNINELRLSGNVMSSFEKAQNMTSAVKELKLLALGRAKEKFDTAPADPIHCLQLKSCPNSKLELLPRTIVEDFKTTNIFIRSERQ